MWIAREENGELLLFAEKPIHNFHTKSYMNQSGWCDGCYIGELESDIFPEVTFENSPIEVELKLKNRNENK